MSSSDLAVSVRGLSKCYRISDSSNRPTTAVEALASSFRNLGRPAPMKEFWALHDVSFDINRGEVVGIVGRNGAGKSTLLKVLSRITEPTGGSADLYGRVGSLLEVGTGFHQELTGRENIYLNGSILGMKRTEITRVFDDIVDFAGVEQFLDTPVKRYSSGMYTRLAFAVAANLNPEILIIDEVLAVGDAAFQKKCLGKMEDVAKSGRTVFFVSHQMASVLSLCTRGILLDKGRVALDGTTADVVDAYIRQGVEQASEVVWNGDDAPGGDVAKLRAVRVLDRNGRVSSDYYLSDAVAVELEFDCLTPNVRLNPCIHLFDSHNACVFVSGNLEDPEWGQRIFQPGRYRAECRIPGRLLNDGQYRVAAIVTQDSSTVVARKNDVVVFNVNDDGAGRGDYTGNWMGIIRPDLSWCVEPLGGEKL